MNHSLPKSRRFSRQLVLMAALGTLVPLVMLAMLYALAPLPLSTAAAASLRTANAVAGVLVSVNAVAVAVLWVANRLMRRRLPAQGAWQPVRMSRRASA